MDERKLHELLAEGENERVDFKLELKLDTAQEKAEFIKDVISLANSAQSMGYLLVGIDNSGVIRGCTRLEEERIQQLSSTYISPSVNLRCFIIPTTIPNMVTVGIIEIQATKKPHQVARSIERLDQNEVFVRHGTVVEKASPEEMFAMRESDQTSIHVRQLTGAAESHLKLGYIEMALKAYSSAIELAPHFELFMARGQIYQSILRRQAKQYGRPEAFLAYKDFSSAMILAETDAQQKEARIQRWQLIYLVDDGQRREMDWDYDKEFDWLKQNTTGPTRGSILLSDILLARSIFGLSTQIVDKPDSYYIDRINEVIQLGYVEPEVYLARAEAHSFDHDYGLALRDIELAAEKGGDGIDKENCQQWRKDILEKIKAVDPYYRV